MSPFKHLSGEFFFNGDVALAEGAIAAGCRFFAGYPITPATEIAERMAERMPEVGGSYIQMEDELGSMNAVLGASWAGVKAMTATSGPGFSLMMENLGLGVMLETPCVLADIQRAGPSTGLPTLPAQGDMMQARYGSHGCYSIIAISPSSPQEMFDLAIRAFDLSEKYRTPVLIMADAVVGHMSEKVVIPPAGKINTLSRRKPSVPSGKYLPYQADSSLVPPMANAGDGYRFHVTGLTHDERGYPSDSVDVQDRLVRRLIDKIEKNKDDIVMLEQDKIEDAEVVVCSYGISARIAKFAVERARKEGLKVGMLRLITVWPFPEEKIGEIAGSIRAYVVPEINCGQISREIERACHGKIDVVSVPHLGGGVHQPGVILDAIKKAAK